MILTIIGIIVGIVAGANTLMEFGERIHTYYKALKARRKRLLNSTYRSTKLFPVKAEPPPSKNDYVPGSYRAHMWLLPYKDYDVDIGDHDPPQKEYLFKKNSFQTA